MLMMPEIDSRSICILQWRHMGVMVSQITGGSIALFNSKLLTKKISKLCNTKYLGEESTSDRPHKGLVMRKAALGGPLWGSFNGFFDVNRNKL